MTVSRLQRFGRKGLNCWNPAISRPRRDKKVQAFLYCVKHGLSSFPYGFAKIIPPLISLK